MIRLYRLSIVIWLIIGIYGIFYNLSYIDEAKYLIKGWLISTGQVGYYTTPEFFYQHMPGALLWFGWGQKLFGPSLLVGRLQSLLLSGLILYLTYSLAKNLAGKTAGKLSLMILALAPVAGLYYAAAIPQALSVTVLLLALLAVSRQKYLWSSFWFSLALVVRENFLFTLAIYLLFLVWLVKDWKIIAKNILVVLLTLSIFFLPGWPGILEVFYNFPGISNLLPISQVQKTVLGLNWMQTNHSFDLYFQAIKEFGIIYFSLIISLLIAALGIFKLKLATKTKPTWYLLLILAGFNFLAHAWSAFQLSPRAIVSYLAYIVPLLAVIGAVAINRQAKPWLKYYPGLLLLALASVRFASITGHLNQPTNLRQINESIKPLQEITAGKNNIIWFSEPMALYLAGRVSYYPLINHTNFFKPSDDTTTVQSLGFWNQDLMLEWLNEADLVVIDSNRLSLMQQSALALPTATMINNRLQQQFSTLELNQYIWPGNLRFFQK